MPQQKDREGKAMATAPNWAPFFAFDQIVQTPFAMGLQDTVNEAMSAIQGPLTAIVVLWIIVTGVLVMRGDVSVRVGITRIISVSLVVGILLSTTLYDQYVVTFFTTGLPNYIATALLDATGPAPSAHSFDVIWDSAAQVFSTAANNLNFFNVLYSVELALLQSLMVVPIGLTFLIYETARILTDVVVCIGPFVLIGYLFGATRGVADRFVSKLIGLTLLTLLVNIVLSIIINGFISYVDTTLANVAVASKPEAILLCTQLVAFLAIGSLITCFLPGIASYIGGGISVSPLAMGASASQANYLMRGSQARRTTKEAH
jgi:type IV secretion system protein VirB6